jgi:fucose permease
MSTTADARRAWTLALFAFTGLSGLVLQVRGALLPTFGAVFGVSEAQLGLIAPLATVGYVVPIVAVGLTAGRGPVRWTLLAGAGGTALLLGGISLAPTYPLLAVALAIRMLPTGLVRGLDRPILSHLYADDRGRIFNLQTTCWAIGAALGPAFVTVLLPVADWRAVYAVLAVLTLPILLAVWRLDPPESLAHETALSLPALGRLLRRTEVQAMALMLVLVVGAESTLFTWLPYYGTRFFARGSANLLLSTYLLAYIPGRLGFAWALGRVDTAPLVGAAALVATGGVLGLAVAPGYWKFGAVFLVGLMIAGLFPSILAWGTDAAPEYSAPVNAVGMTAGQVGFFLFPAIVGVTMTAVGVTVGMLVPGALLAALAVVVAALRFGGVT